MGLDIPKIAKMMPAKFKQVNCYLDVNGHAYNTSKLYSPCWSEISQAPES